MREWYDPLPEGSVIHVSGADAQEVARPGRLELPTLCLEGRRSIQLSYGRTNSF